MRKMLTSISGDAIRCSTIAKTTSNRAPATMNRMVPALAHPQIPACWKPTMLSETRSRSRRVPWKSIGAHLYSVLGREIAIRTSAITATGMLTQKMARQVHSVR